MSRYHVANSYGLFRRMTGVDGRPEVVLEYSDDVKGPWKEYHFMYKPGDVTAAPVFVRKYFSNQQLVGFKKICIYLH